MRQICLLGWFQCRDRGADLSANSVESIFHEIVFQPISPRFKPIFKISGYLSASAAERRFTRQFCLHLLYYFSRERSSASVGDPARSV
jgi:hypothetical protein